MFDGSDPISSNESIIDSREVIARIEYLNPFKVVPAGLDINDAVEGFKTREEAEEHIADMPEIDHAGFEVIEAAEESEELKALQEFADEASNSCDDWQYGAALVHKNYFEDYARQYAQEVCEYDESNASWPFTCINWEEAAEELAVDYSEVGFNGETYLVR